MKQNNYQAQASEPGPCPPVSPAGGGLPSPPFWASPLILHCGIKSLLGTLRVPELLGCAKHQKPQTSLHKLTSNTYCCKTFDCLHVCSAQLTIKGTKQWRNGWDSVGLTERLVPGWKVLGASKELMVFYLNYVLWRCTIKPRSLYLNNQQTIVW